MTEGIYLPLRYFELYLSLLKDNKSFLFPLRNCRTYFLLSKTVANTNILSLPFSSFIFSFILTRAFLFHFSISLLLRSLSFTLRWTNRRSMWSSHTPWEPPSSASLTTVALFSAPTPVPALVIPF